MNGSSNRLFALALAFASAQGCRSPQPAPSAPVSPVPPAAAAPVPVAPAQWTVRYLARPGRAAVEAGGTRVEVDENGARWLLTPGGPERAPTFFAEPIERAMAADDELLFVGETGNVYPVPAASPLGPAAAARRAPVPLAHLAAGRRAIVGSAKGELVRSVDGGRTWGRVDVGGAPRGVDSIALAGDGTGALLMVPQRSLVTTDDGATWIHVPPPRLGIARVWASRDRVVAECMLCGASSYLLTRPLRWVEGIPPQAGASPPGPVPPAAEPPPSLSYQDGGVLGGTRYYEVVLEQDARSLVVEDLTEQNPPRRLRALAGCESATVGASSDGRALVVACAASATNGGVATLRSTDWGETWAPDASFPGAYVQQIAVGPEGRTIIAGASATTAQPGAGVAGTAGRYDDIVIEPRGESVSLQQIAFGKSTVVAIGRVGGGAAAPGLVLLVSEDGGAHMRVVHRWGAPPFDPRLSVAGEDAVVVLGADRRGLLVSRDGGRSWVASRIALPPAPLTRGFDLAGARGLAVTRDGAFETLDAGQTWKRLDDAPLFGRPRDADGEPDALEVRCGEQACMVGDTVRRVGWSSGRAAPESGKKPRGPEAETPRPPVLRCRFSGSAEPSGLTLREPTLDLDRGVRWITTGSRTHPPAMAAVVDRRRSGRLVRETVALPVAPGTDKQHAPSPSDYAYALQLSDAWGTGEGIAVVSYASETLFRNYVGKGKVAVGWIWAGSPGAPRSASVLPGADARSGPVSARVLEDGTALLSVGFDHYVLGERGVVGRWRSLTPDPASSLVSIDGKTLATSLGLVFQDIAVDPARALADGGVTTWRLPRPPHPAWTTYGGVVSRRGSATAWTALDDRLLLVPLGSLEPEPGVVVAVDVEALLSAVPLRGCSPSMQEQVRVPYALPHPLRVQVEGEAGHEAFALDAVEAVLRAGADGVACVSALLAVGADASGNRAAVAMFPEDLEHATLLSPLGRGEGSVEPVSCRYVAGP